MLREVYDRRLVGRGPVVEAQFVVVGPRVGRRHVEVAGIAFLAVLADVVQFQGWAGFRHRDFRVPDDLVESLDAAVERVGAVVGGERVFPAVERELALGDAVAVATHETAEIGRLLQVFRKRVVAEHHVAQLAHPARHADRLDNAAVVGNLHDMAPGILERVEVHRLAVSSAPGLLGNFGNFAAN